MKRWNIKYLSISLLSILLACANKGEIIQKTDSYSWHISSTSPKNSFTVYAFKIGPDGHLYATGWDGTQRIFARLTDDRWQILAQVDETGIVDFTIFNDTIYYSNYNVLKKAKVVFLKQFLSVDFCGLEVYNENLILTGTPIEYNGNKYTIMSYDLEGKLTPIDSGLQSGTIKKLNNKLFIAGHPLKIYDGQTLSTLDYYGGFLNIDNSESIYTWVNIDSLTIRIRKFKDNNYQYVGNSIKSSCIINNLELNGNTKVVCGVDVDTLISETFLLDSGNNWASIETSFLVTDLINYNNKIFAATNDGQIFELVKD